jgi:ATP-dependent RNA helicase DDX5/DBP2
MMGGPGNEAMMDGMMTQLQDYIMAATDPQVVGTWGVKRAAETTSTAYAEMHGAADHSGWQTNGWDSGWKSGTSTWQDGSSWKSSWQSSNDKWKQGSAEVEEDIDVEARAHGYSFLPPIAQLTESLQSAVSAGRQVMEVVVKGETAGHMAPPISSFAELSTILPPYVTSSLAQAGIVAPFPVQQHTLPFTLRGFDLIGIAKTGSGKTLAFLLPAIAHCEMKPPMPQAHSAPSAVILAPVRELAVQIAEEANKILWASGSSSHPRGMGCVALYGGGGKVRQEQLNSIRKGYSHIIVGTPGRMLDFLQSGDLVLDRVVFFVLDEADRMLDGGFEDQMNDIAEKIRPERQTLFFSATWPAAVRKLAKNMCRSPPVRVSIGQCPDEATGPSARSDITQEIIVFDGGPRRPWSDEDLARIANEKTARMHAHLRACLANPVNKVLVFVNTKTMAWELGEQLQKEGFAADAMYGGLSQNARAECVRKFKDAETKLVVTTDVMARGLDIPNISHVLVYDCYGGIDDYVHRIGRTARGLSGAVGHALVFYEFDPKYAQMPAEIITLLQGAGQHVPPLLQQIANDVESGVRKAVHGVQRKKQKKW